MRPKKSKSSQILSDLKNIFSLFRNLPIQVKINYIKTRFEMENVKEEDFSKLFTGHFSQNWFGSYTANTWKHFLFDDSLGVKNYLEIGSFEGRSTLFAAHLFPNAHITAIDTFSGATEHKNDDFSNVEYVFRNNIKPLLNRLTVHKGTSAKVLPSLAEKIEHYDVIFIDGSHYFRHVLQDTLLSWPLLKVNGYMIWDDYLWWSDVYGRKMSPKSAIDHFLNIYKNDYQMIFSNSQICIKKLKSERRFTDSQ